MEVPNVNADKNNNKTLTASNDAAAVSDDGVFLDIKLAEDDPLYEKKKKLLQDKGFAPDERVFLNSASHLDSVDVMLDELLQRARIFHLNDLELYFGTMVVDPAQEFYSPRNELEALNFILSLVDILIKNNSNSHVLQDLRDAILKKIDNFGGKNTAETETFKEAGDNEKSLMQWAESNGVKSKLQIAYVEGAGRGAIAEDDLGVGEIALEIPISLIISEDLVYESDMIAAFKETDSQSAETMLLLWSMREKHNIDSKYKSYFDTLPDEFHTGLSFGVEAMIALDETLASQEILQAKEVLRSRYEELIPALCSSYPDLFPKESYTWEHYLWACELWYSNSMRIMFPDGKIKTCLIPVAGFLNHSVYPHIQHYGKVDSETNSLKFPLSRSCKMGEQCFLSYGNLSNSHLLTFYGFLTKQDNPYDVIPMDIEAPQDCSSEEDNPMCDAATHMVRGTWLSTNHDIFHYGLPSPLLECLRKLWNPDVQSMRTSLENLEIEMEILEFLRGLFDDMMVKLGDSSEDDRKHPRRDVQLSEQYKDVQRNIISSILTACHSGRSMVEHELEKCMK